MPVLVAACSSATPDSSHHASSRSSRQFELLSSPVGPIGPIPPDVPLFLPACDSSGNLALTNGYETSATPVPAGLQDIVSVCADPAGDVPEVMVIYNLTDDVLDISAADGTSPQIVLHYPTPASALPSWDDLEIYAQNQTVRTQQAGAGQGTFLIPVGGAAEVYMDASSPPLDINVSVDQGRSALTYGAQLLTGYVADHLLSKVSVLSYLSSITGCVNAAYAVWQDLTRRANAGTTMINALQAYQPCKELTDKVRENRAEALTASSEPDLEKVADSADASTWESRIEDLQETHDITIDIR